MSVWLTFAVPLANFLAATVLPLIPGRLRESVRRAEAEIMRPGFNRHSRCLGCLLLTCHLMIISLSIRPMWWECVGKSPEKHKGNERRKEAAACALQEVLNVFWMHQQNAVFQNSIHMFTTFTSLCNAFRKAAGKGHIAISVTEFSRGKQLWYCKSV